MSQQQQALDRSPAEATTATITQEQSAASISTDGQPATRLCVLLACFAGEKRAAQIKADLARGIRSSGGTILDEVVLKVTSKGKASVYDPRRTTRGLLTSGLTWGLFGLVAGGGSVTSLVIWAVLGALCGGLYAYFTEHLLTKDQLARIGERMGADTSALAIWAEASDAERLLAATATLQPTIASVAAIADDLSAEAYAEATSPVANASTGPRTAESREVGVLSMLLLRYPGERAAKAALEAATKTGDAAPQVELIFESDKNGKRHVSSPSSGVSAMSKSDVQSWGIFGLVWGAIVGIVGDGGIAGAIENGVVTGVLWAIFGLVAGALYGLWAGRAVSAGQLHGIGPLLPPDSSLILAWADGASAERTIRALSTADAATLTVRFASAAGGAVLGV